jgi:hypothetical protein
MRDPWGPYILDTGVDIPSTPVILVSLFAELRKGKRAEGSNGATALIVRELKNGCKRCDQILTIQ